MKIEILSVKQLSLDLHNFRTIPQSNEVHAISAMIAVNATKFWGLMESILDDGFTVTENILVLASGKRKLTVKEGNRRVAILKLIHGLHPIDSFDIPIEMVERIATLTPGWKQANFKVPCCIYEKSEIEALDRIVSRTHGKGEKSSRDQWKAVARSRHNRDFKKSQELGLDLLEAYLEHGKNLTPYQKERWAGDYPLTVLDEAVKKLAVRWGITSRAVASLYPSKHKRPFDQLLVAIGNEQVGFDEVRNPPDFATALGFPLPVHTGDTKTSGQSSGSTGSADNSQGGSGANQSGGAGGQSGAGAGTGAGKSKAAATNDPKSVNRTLNTFFPQGPGREKLATVLEEARGLKLTKHPIAFCFLLRSMFELSAKAYCNDQGKAAGVSATKNGNDRKLVDILREITNDLTSGRTDQEKLKELHGPMSVLATADSFLSVTSMNQLVHHPTFTLDETHIATLFHNVFPLLKAMNT